jgi:hypothetical protein
MHYIIIRRPLTGGKQLAAKLVGRGGGEDLTPLEIRAAALGGYGAQVVAAVLDARPKIVLEVVSGRHVRCAR